MSLNEEGHLDYSDIKDDPPDRYPEEEIPYDREFNREDLKE